MDFSQALALMDEGKFLSNGKETLTRTEIEIDEKKVKVLAQKAQDGSYTQVMPCQSYFDDDWEVKEE